MMTRINGIRDWMDSLRAEGHRTRGAREGAADGEGFGTSGGHADGEDKSGEEAAGPDSSAAEDPRERARRDADNLKTALDGFRGDAHTQALGLQVETEGYGPGLKVILRDARGEKMRVMARDEFVRLREAVGALGPDKGVRGGILDKKA